MKVFFWTRASSADFDTLDGYLDRFSICVHVSRSYVQCLLDERN